MSIKVERFAALIPKLRIAPIILGIHPDAPVPPSIGVKRGVGHCCGAGSKNGMSNEIQNTDATMTEEYIEYIRQMLEEDREILVKLS